MAEPLRLLPSRPMKETAKAKAAYAAYAAMGSGRSLRKLAEQRDKSGTKAGQLFKQFGKWSSAHRWQERVATYDAEQETERQRKRAESIDKMDEEQAALSRMLLIRAVDILKRRLEADTIGGYALVQLFEKAANLERVARGAITERIEETSMLGGQIGFYPVQLPQKEEPRLALPGKYAENEETTITSNIA